jgi:predicted nucleic acid-binding protein
MGDFIIDANVLMSMLISGKAIYRTLLKECTFISSDFALIEIEKYNDVIQQKTRLDKDTFQEFSYFLFSNINFMPSYLIDNQVKTKAKLLVSDIDLKDVSYVALAIQLDITLLTRDKLLYEKLRKKGFRKVQLFDDFLRNY